MSKKFYFNPLHGQEFDQVLFNQPDGEETRDTLVPTVESFTVPSIVPAGQSYTVTLSNSIATDHVIVETDNFFLKHKISADGLREMDYTIDGNTVTIYPSYYDLNAGDDITVYYFYGQAPLAPITGTVTLGTGSWAVDGQNNVTLTLPITNTYSGNQQVTLDVELDGVTKQVVLDVPNGTTNFDVIFNSVDPGTYTANITGDLTGTIPNVVVPALVADLDYNTFYVNGANDTYTVYTTVTNSGSAIGSTSINFRLDSDTSINYPVTVSPSTSVTRSHTYSGLSGGAHTLAAYEDNDTTLIGSESVTVSVVNPVEIPDIIYDGFGGTLLEGFWDGAYTTLKSIGVQNGGIVRKVRYTISAGTFVQDIRTIIEIDASTITSATDVDIYIRNTGSAYSPVSNDMSSLKIYRSTATTTGTNDLYTSYDSGTNYYGGSYVTTITGTGYSARAQSTINTTLASYLNSQSGIVRFILIITDINEGYGSAPNISLGSSNFPTSLKLTY